MAKTKLRKRSTRERCSFLEGWLAGFRAGDVAKPENRIAYQMVVERELDDMRKRRADANKARRSKR